MRPSSILVTRFTRLLLWWCRDQAALNTGPQTPCSWSTPTEYPEGHGRVAFLDQQNTCGPVLQTPMNPQAACGGYRAGPVFHSQDENRIVPLNLGFNCRLNPHPRYSGIDLARRVIPLQLEPTLWSPSLRCHHPALPLQQPCPNCHEMLQSAKTEGTEGGSPPPPTPCTRGAC